MQMIFELLSRRTSSRRSNRFRDVKIPENPVPQRFYLVNSSHRASSLDAIYDRLHCCRILGPGEIDSRDFRTFVN